MAALRVRLEDAVLVALAPMLLASGGYLQALDVYAGEFASAEAPDELRAVLSGRVPAVLIFTASGAYRGLDVRRRRATLDLSLHLYVVSGCYRSQASRVRGDSAGADPGIYQILEDCRDRLFGLDLGVTGAGPPAPVSEAALTWERDLAIWEQVYSVDTDAVQQPAVDPDLTDLAADINYPDDPDADPIVEITIPVV